ncbi:MAG: ABC transporter permease subunit [Planctomycetes bacterium]|nr:ABC transporter permease subunit [Planctomycetota bacterium]
MPRRPRRFRRGLFVFAALLLGSVLALDWNLDAVTSWSGFRAALERLSGYLGGFAAPDLSTAMLARCGTLALETVSVALLGTALGLALAIPLALGSARCVVLGDGRAGGLAAVPARLLLEACRLALDAMRGVPDFLWAVLLANITGVNAVTGMLAIGIHVAGILGKVLGEQWDNVDPARYEALRSTGAGRLQVFAYGVQPLAARALLSFVLMRTECAVRNASVIGVVGGGGLGAALWDEYSDGNWARMATVLLSLLAVTTVTDLGANLLRRQLRVDPNHPRIVRPPDRRTALRRRGFGLAVVAAVLAGALAATWPAIERAYGELARVEWAFVREFAAGLAVPDLSPATLRSVLGHCLVPLALGVTATALAAASAALLAFPGSVAFQLEAARFTGERLAPLARARRAALVVATRFTALVLRGIPEVAWVVLLAVFFRQGITPCVVAVALHGTGVLQRVFTETIDDLPYRTLEHGHGPARAQLFAWAAVPRALPDWRTYTFFQFEVNVRIGITLGLVGAGGLGDRFDSNLKFREFAVASTYLCAMVLLTVAIDRTSRWLQLRRQRC